MKNQKCIQRIFMGIFLLAQTLVADAFSNVKLIENWSKYNDFGPISGVGVDTSGNVFVFHRGDRSLVYGAFTADFIFKFREKGPIKQSTIVVLHPETGDLITQTGASTLVY